MLGTILLFILIFCVIVISHEFGHFIVARINGIRVSEFTVGVGPKLFGFKKNGTEFCFRLLPFGGACIYELDEDGLPFGLEREAKEKVEESEEADAGFINDKSGVAFAKAPVWSRIATVLAGPVFNFILAYILALVVVWFTGSSRPVITGLMEGYPAKEAGMQEGDLITRMNGSRVYLANEIYINTYINGGKEMTIDFTRDGEKHSVTVTPRYDDEVDRYLVGFNGYGEYVYGNNAGVFKYAAYEVRYGVVGTVKGLLMMLTGNGSKDDIGGPVAMATAIDDVKEAASPYGGWIVALNMMNLAMLLSVNLGIVNLLPLPAIDGGRLLFLIIEAVTGRKIPPEKEGLVHLVGFVLLILLMIFVTYNDIIRLLSR